MTDTSHLIDFQAADIDWQCEVLFDGEGFAIQWVSQLDSPTEISGNSLDLIGCWMPDRKIVNDRQTIWWPGHYASLRTLALGEAELHRDRIEARHQDDMDGARMDHAGQRATSAGEG